MNNRKKIITKLGAASLLLLGFSACSMDLADGNDGASQGTDATPGASVTESVRVNMAPTGLRISGDAELLTNIVYADGSEVAFVRTEGSYMLSELSRGGPSRLAGLPKHADPRDYFRALAPNVAMPSALEDASTKHGWDHLAASSANIEQLDTAQRVQQQTPERELELGPEAGEAPGGGLQAFNTCDTTTFLNQACDFGDQHDVIWIRTNRTSNGNKNQTGVVAGDTTVCAKDGPITVRVAVSGFFSIERDLSTGDADHRLWETRECKTSCLFWDCDTFCFPDERTITNEVFNVDSGLSDKYHFCGFYEK